MAPTHSNALAHALAPRCAGCREVVHVTAAVVNFGDLQFHPGCEPRCSVCGRYLPPGASGWRSAGRVVSEPWGYGVRPTHFWCPECLGTVPRDEPRVHC